MDEVNNFTACRLAEWTEAEWTRAEWTGAEWTGAEWTGAEWTDPEWTGAEWTVAEWTDPEWTDPECGASEESTGQRSGWTKAVMDGSPSTRRCKLSKGQWSMLELSGRRPVTSRTRVDGGVD